MRDIGAGRLNLVGQKIESSGTEVCKKSKAIEQVFRTWAEDASTHRQACASQSADAQKIDSGFAPAAEQEMAQARDNPSSECSNNGHQLIPFYSGPFHRFIHTSCPHVQASSFNKSV
jgi:hypothetical protein